MVAICRGSEYNESDYPGNWMKLGFFGMCAAAALTAGHPARADGDINLKELSLKRILDLDVTSVSKRTQKLQDVATSIYVITAEDIRRSGATRLQDVLKLAPGAWFSDASFTTTAEGVREGAHAFSLTESWLLDGIPITNPIIGGIFWPSFDLPIEDIERIEVIKGPGGTIYGANSASGIISIFTKRGEAAEGFRASLSGGTQNYLAPYVRYGVEAKEDLFLTLWGKFRTHDGYDRNPMFAGDSLDAPINGGGDIPVANRFRGRDDWQQGFSGGVKWDYQPRDDRKWSGQVLHNQVGDGQYSIHRFPWPDSAPPAPAPQTKRPDSIYEYPESMDQTFAQARLDATPGPDDSWFLNAYYWRYRYDLALSSGFQEGFDISEAEAQRNFKVLDRHRLGAGANLRRVEFGFHGMPDAGSIFTHNRDYQAYLAGAFLQDEIALGERLKITLGAKAETWTLVSLVPEISPSVRLAWKPAPDRTWWAAASRSITTPSYAQWDFEARVAQIPPEWYLKQHPGLPSDVPAAGHWVALLPGNDMHPVDYYSLEAGHRGSHAYTLQWDISTFFNFVRGQVGLTPIDSSLQTLVPSRAHAPDSIVPLFNANLVDFESFGGEAIVRWLPADFLRLELSYSLFYPFDFTGLKIPGDPKGRYYSIPEGSREQTPHHVGRARVYLDLPWDFSLTVNGLVSSPFSRGEAFNYYEQEPASATLFPDQGITVDPPRTQLQLDFSLQKEIWRDRLSATLWGRNILADPFVEIYNQYGWESYPHQVHRTFGGGLVYQF
jgi:iron complex outermembrane receptor protein